MAVKVKRAVVKTPKFTLTMTKDRTKTIIYEFDFNPCEVAGGDDPTCTPPAALPAEIE